MPEVLSLGGQLKLTRFFGVGINIGLIPTVKLALYGDAKVSYQEYDVYGRIYPFGGAFFVGAGAGYATVHGTVATSYQLSAADRALYQMACQASGQVCPVQTSIESSSQASVRTLVLTPQIGFMHVFESGFALGLDVGAQIPIAPSKVDFSSQVEPSPLTQLPIVQMQYMQYVNSNDQKVRSTLNTIGRTPLPTFNLKIGWFL